MSDHEIRQNKASGEWVIFAPARGKRPRDFSQQAAKSSLPEHEANCPFCVGNDNMLPGILLQMDEPNNGWKTRVVPNKFAALSSTADTRRYDVGMYTAMPGYGIHEVIIEHPQHNQDISTMPLDDVKLVIETYHKRYLQIMQEHKNMLPLLFRNHGARAGTSLIHPHSQLIVTGFVPNHIRHREEEAQRYYDQYGRCVFCDMMEFEKSANLRVVFENDSFLAFVPFAADVPFEVWIMPKQHHADFGEVTKEQKQNLADALRTLLERIHNKLNDPDYNYIINTSARYKADEPQLHWYLQIRPRLTTRAGFEIGSGISINPSLPEEDARFLRE